jgi:hypothetical protein
MVAAIPVKVACQKKTELQHSEKFTEDERAPIMRQTSMLKTILTFCGDRTIAWYPN